MNTRITTMHQKAREIIRKEKETSMMIDLAAEIETKIITGTKRAGIVMIAMKIVIDQNIEVNTKANTANVKDLEVVVHTAQKAVINQSYHLI